TLYLSFHLQIVLGMPPLEAGLANLPLTLAIMVMAPIATKLLPVIGPRPLLVVGPLVVAAGLVYLSRITADGDYLVQVLPGLVLMGVGMAGVFVPLQNLALSGVEPQDAGAASATANSAMQIGGSIGLSVFTAIYAGVVAAAPVAEGASPLPALTSGYAAIFLAAAIVMAAGSLVAAFLIRGSKSELLPQGDAPVVVHA
ncbi:MAG: MFS transporter, partial [Herbiconiux sp.]|nr:MFS transporter [Herbiconiux sp.]